MLPDRRVRQRDYLLEIARALTQELNLDALLDRILGISLEMLAGQAGLIALRSETGIWRVNVSQALTPAFLKRVEPALAALPDQTAQTEELPEINRILQELTLAATLGMLSGVGLPLVARQQVVGVIFIFRAYVELFTANDRALLGSFADQAAIAVQNAQLYTQVIREKQRMDALVDSAADGILILTSDHRVERYNPALERVLVASHATIQGKLHSEVIRWHNHPQGLTLEQAEAGGWPLTPHAQLYVEGDLKRFNELGPLPVAITYAPLLSPEGVVLNIIASVRDITRFRQAEELKSTFISIISHELKTPVALIKGYTSTLRREDARWDRNILQDSLAVIEEEADRLTLLIENLLDASRLQAGGLPLKRADVAIPTLAARLAERFQTQTSRHKLLVDFPPDYPIVLADETRIEQVLSNLISNAIKYAADGEVHINGQIRPDIVVVCVSDQGPGISPEDIPHVFDRFYRAPDMARQTKGAGLGLFLARAIIEAHGGRIWVDNEAGRGARICFSVPRD
jgi:K+-sensing histidine kinase KdpD